MINNDRIYFTVGSWIDVLLTCFDAWIRYCMMLCRWLSFLNFNFAVVIWFSYVGPRPPWNIISFVVTTIHTVPWWKPVVKVKSWRWGNSSQDWAPLKGTVRRRSLSEVGGGERRSIVTCVTLYTLTTHVLLLVLYTQEIRNACIPRSLYDVCNQ